MRVLFTTWNAPSHLFPSVPLAHAFVAAGHDVVVAAPANCCAAIAAAGLHAEPVGQAIDVAATSSKGVLACWHQQVSWPDGWAENPSLLGEGETAILAALGAKQLGVAAAMLDGLLDLAARWRPELVVHDAGTYAGRVCAAALGVPSISHMWGSPALLRLERHRLDGAFHDGYARLFARAGIDPVADSTRWLDPCPSALQVTSPTPRHAIRPVPYNGAGSVPAWLATGRDGRSVRRVAVTWGVSAAQFRPGELPPLLGHAVRAAAAVADEVVLALPQGQGALLPELPENVRVAENVPLRALLPSCDAVLHQGGGGTTMTAVATGTPQLIVAPRPEQMLTGRRIAAVGAGRSHVANELAARSDATRVITGDLTALLDDTAYRTDAVALAGQAAAMPSPEQVVAQLVALARSGQAVPA